MAELKYQDFFLKLIAEFPEMPRIAIWLDKYGDKAFASWGGITQQDRLWGMVVAGHNLGQRFTSETGIGDFRYSLTFGTDGVFLVILTLRKALQDSSSTKLIRLISYCLF
jgi:hypothetical protein